MNAYGEFFCNVEKPGDWIFAGNANSFLITV
jgi:hypothetical protein